MTEGNIGYHRFDQTLITFRLCLSSFPYPPSVYVYAYASAEISVYGYAMIDAYPSGSEK